MPNLFDNDADAVDDLFADAGQEILYNGVSLLAIVRSGPDRGRLPGLDAVGASMAIRVRRVDISTTAKGTPVVIDGVAWKVDKEASTTTQTVVLDLLAKAVPVPRRSL